jgi:hypothetical protein
MTGVTDRQTASRVYNHVDLAVWPQKVVALS